VVTPATFLQLFPEFQETNALLIQGKLTLAAARMGGPDYTVWGPPANPATNPPTIADSAQCLLAAHYLMTSPFGVSTLMAQPKSGNSKTPYLEQFEELEQAVAGGFAVASRPV